MATKVLVLVGTKKGGFIVESDPARSGWAIRGPLCEGWSTMDMTLDPSTGTIYAGCDNAWYGPAVFRSDDLGETWTHSSAGLTYGDDGPKLTKVWSVTPAHDAVFAGVDPAGLFRSDDRGATWQHVTGLTEHPTRPTWNPGNGGLILHTIIPHPTDPARMWIAISAVGTFFTADGGRTWEPRNRGVRADFNPDPNPVTGHCVHKLAMAADDPDHLYQQNHCGVYRTFDGGLTWQEITAGLPSEFGFPVVAHPRDPRSAWVIPLNGADKGRYVPDAAAAVWRTRDGGDSWTRLSAGLPQTDAYVGVLREAMAIDRLDPAGIYVGTSTGELYASADEGESWSLVTGHLPPIHAVDVALVEG